MRNITAKLVEIFYQSEEFRRRMAAYDAIMRTEEWQFIKDMLLSVKGEMMGDVFSYRYTTLDEREKDVVQRAYYNINQMLDFLIDPKGWITLKSKWKKVLSDQAVRFNRANKEGE